jgi:hypothetical protein
MALCPTRNLLRAEVGLFAVGSVLTSFIRSTLTGSLNLRRRNAAFRDGLPCRFVRGGAVNLTALYDGLKNQHQRREEYNEKNRLL